MSDILNVKIKQELVDKSDIFNLVKYSDLNTKLNNKTLKATKQQQNISNKSRIKVRARENSETVNLLFKLYFGKNL